MASGSYSLLSFFPKLTDSAPRSVVLQPDRETDSKYAFKEKRPVGRPPRKEQVQPPSSASVLPVVGSESDTDESDTDLPHSSTSSSAIPNTHPGESTCSWNLHVQSLLDNTVCTNRCGA